MEDILNILVSYSEQRKLGDINFIKKVLDEIFLNNENLHHYIKDVVFINNLKSPTIFYNCIEKKLIINLDKIYQECSKICDKTLSDECLYRNIYIIYVLLKGINSVRLFKAGQQKIVDIETLICNILYNPEKEFIKKDKLTRILLTRSSLFKDSSLINNLSRSYGLKIYYSNINPLERLANYYSIKELEKLIRPLMKFNPRLDKGIKDGLNQMLIKGYDFSKTISSPTTRFFDEYYSQTEDNSKYLDIEYRDIYYKANNSALETRKKYGLRLTLKEYNDMETK